MGAVAYAQTDAYQMPSLLEAQNDEPEVTAQEGYTITAEEKEEFDRLREQNAADKEEDRRNSVWRKGNIRLEYIANEKLKSPASEIESDWGFGFAAERAYYLHRRPILGMIKIGLDWSYELWITKYKDQAFDMGFQNTYINDLMGDQVGEDIYQGGTTLGIGPSVTFAPFGFTDNFLNKLNARAFFHYRFGLSGFHMETDGLLDDDSILTAFCYGPSYGLRISLNRLSLGVEFRSLTSKYKCKYYYEEYVNDRYYEDEGSEKIKFKTTSVMLSVGLNF